MRNWGILFLCYLFLHVTSGVCDFTDDINSCYNKFLSFEAIGDIHKYLDDDQNGEVDSSEAAKFVRNEFSPAERAQQTRSLPREDPYISLTDLWAMWQRNPAFNWTVKQTIRWLVDYVDLPQYEDIFMRHSISGKSIPLLAMKNASYLTDVLMIRNPIHKKKIMVKALDTILFGPPQRRFLLTTETSLVTASFGLTVLVLFGFSHWLYSTFFSKSNPHDCDKSFAATETALKDFQSRLDDLERLRFALNKCEQDTPNTSTTFPASTEKQRLRDFSEAARLPSVTEFKRPLSTSVNEWLLSTERGTTSDCPPDPFNPSPCDERLDHAEEVESSCWFSNTDCAHTITDWDNQPSLKSVSLDPSAGSDVSELALWLQLTYALEMQQYSAKKIDAESHLQNIRQACKRLHRKRYTILGSVRLIHSDSLDDLERRLIQAKLVLEQLQHEMRERHRRWARIETLLGLKVRNNLGPARIQHLLTTGANCARPLPTDQPPLIPGPECEFKSSEPRETEEPGDTEGEQGLYFQVKRKETGRATFRSSSGKSQMPRNYSFVRPFVTLWRKKAGSRVTNFPPTAP